MIQNNLQFIAKFTAVKQMGFLAYTKMIVELQLLNSIFVKQIVTVVSHSSYLRNKLLLILFIHLSLF